MALVIVMIMVKVGRFVVRILFEGDVVHLGYSILFHVMDLPCHIFEHLALLEELSQLRDVSCLGCVGYLLV